jgi:hypothetical protein
LATTPQWRQSAPARHLVIHLMKMADFVVDNR